MTKWETIKDKVAPYLPARNVYYQRPPQQLQGKALNAASKQAQRQALQRYRSRTTLPTSTPSEGASLENQRK